MSASILRNLLAAGAFVALVGCTHSQRATGPRATPDELPSFTESSSTIAASVEVDGQHDLPSVVLVPEFTEPELTPEEREILGPEQVKFDFLRLYSPALGPEHGVAPWPDPLRTGSYGRTGVSAAHGPARSISETGYGRGGADVGSQGQPRHIGSASRFSTGVAGTGGQGGVNVGQGSASHVSKPSNLRKP
jgi:hypothetical protein